MKLPYTKLILLLTSWVVLTGAVLFMMGWVVKLIK
jgi:hypothetical protein